MKLANKVIAVVLTAALKQVVARRELKGGEPPPPPPEGPGEIETPDLGDLIRLYRDERGVPIVTPGAGGTSCEDHSEGCCLWPLALADDCPDECKDDVGRIHVGAIDPVTCAVNSTCAPCVVETDFGRTSVIRSPPSVLDDQLSEVIRNLMLSPCAPELDPAGRFQYYAGDPLEAYTVDSPIQNLAIYRQLINGTALGGSNVPGLAIPQGQDRLLTAARSLGTASDKGGEVNADMVAYVNRILGLTETSDLTPIEVWMRKEVMGKMANVPEVFLDYSGFDYTRRGNFQNLPMSPYIPRYSEPYTADGIFEHLAEDESLSIDTNGNGLEDSERRFKIEHSGIFATVFNDTDADAGNMNGFVQAADDTRAVINYMHSWPVPADHATKRPPCASSNDDKAFDVFVSRIQAPTYIVLGAEEREIAVYVGITTVTGEAEIELTIFGINKGSGKTYTKTGMLTLTSDAPTAVFTDTVFGFESELTKNLGVIEWTATITDVIPSNDYDNGNNELKAESTVFSGKARKLPAKGEVRRGQGLRGL